jgi:hypothetical protein
VEKQILGDRKVYIPQYFTSPSMKKSWMLFALSLVLLGVFSSAVLADWKDDVKAVFDSVVSVGQLGWAGVTAESYLTGFMRLAIFLLIFTILFAIGSATLAGVAGFSRNIIIAIALILAVISAIFIPGSVLSAIGVAYGTLFSFILIGAVVVGGGFLVYIIPTTNLPLRILRLVLILLLIWILSATVEHAKVLIP